MSTFDNSQIEWSPTPPAASSSSTTQASSSTTRSRLFYTPELKLQLIRLCIENTDRYLELNGNVFWQYILAIFKEQTGYQPGDLRKKVASMVTERQATIEVNKRLSGVAIPPLTDLEQALDDWIEVVERRNDEQKTKSQSLEEIKREKEIHEIKRENLLHTISKKRTFNAVLDAREVVDLTNPVILKKRGGISEEIFVKLQAKQTFRRIYFVLWMNLKMEFCQL